uniref:SMC family ATPase n=1 Tax=Nocardioides sp. REDSEA-S30_B4 TaxID=1811552 RepID=UPI000A443518
AAAGSLARVALAGGDPAGLDPAEPELPLDGRPDLAALERALDRRLGVVRQLRDLTREQAIAEESATQALSRCEEAVTEAGFAELGSALAAALPAAEQERLSTAVEAHRARLAAVTEVLADAPDPGEEHALPDLEVLAARHAAAHAGLATALTGATTSRVRAERLDALVVELTGALETWAPVQEQLRLATSVSAFVDGRSADNPLQMRLSAYVLAWRLSQVVAAANERLARMSDQRYSLEHTGRRGAGETRGGLSLLVRDDWSGESRDPVTLSGGETFVVSLALALGLADVIAQEAGGTELDTLFVDEGFGSLDPDTLEDVMDTLDSLREGGRVVGVVSHVTEMRDRIPVQLHVTKGRSGSSVRLSRGV